METPGLRAIVADATERSPTFRALVDRIERSDVFVYLQCHVLESSTIDGRTSLVVATPYGRYVRVDVRCPNSPFGHTSLIAHEFQHVVEIASVPWVVDRGSFARFYSGVGVFIGTAGTASQFETDAAIATALRVRHELAEPARRTHEH